MAEVIADKNGRPLRERRLRNFGTQPFKGQEGKAHKRTRYLKARQEAYDALPANRQHGRTRAGSLKK